MANIATVQTTQGTSGASYVNSLNLTAFPSNTSPANFISVAIVTSYPSATAVLSVTDSLGNTYTKQKGTAGTGTTNLSAFIYTCTNSLGGTKPVITVTLQAGFFSTISAVAREYSGIATSSAIDSTAQNVESGYFQSHSTGYTGTTTQANDLLVAVYACDNASTNASISGGFSTTVNQTNTGQYTYISYSDKVVNATGSYNASFSTDAYTQGVGLVMAVKGVTATISNPVPDAPIYVMAATDSNRAYISWNAPKTAIIGGFATDTGITGFTVKRATTSGGTYTTLATGLTVSYYDDTSVTNGNTYYYVVTATSNSGTSANSAEAVAVVAAIPAAHADQWYSYGFAPTGVTQTTIRSYLRDHWNKIVTYMFTQSGATLGGWGGYRPQVPDQVFYNSYGNNGTVSEGVGYSMIGAVYMSNPSNPQYDIKALSYFNGLYIYYKYYKDSRGLMNWDINADGTLADYNGATDGDLDICFALFMMHRLRGSSGPINYLAEGIALANALKTYDFLGTSYGTKAYLINNGDGWNPNDDIMAPDYNRFAYYPIFAYHTGDTTWDQIYEANLNFIKTKFTDVYSTGLVPDACDRNGVATSLYNWGVFKYSYNSIRMTWGFTLDYLWNGSARIYNNQKKLADTAFITKAGSNTANVANIKAGPWDLNWTSDAGYSNQTFLAGIGSVCCVQSSTTAFAGAVATWVHNNGATENSYFGLFQGFMNLLLMSGEMTPTFGTIPPPPTVPGATTAAFLLNMV